MKTFSVIITRDITESCAMVLEALSAEEVEEIALQRAEVDADLVWEVDDNYHPDDDMYVTDVTEEPTDLAVRHELEQKELTDETEA